MGQSLKKIDNLLIQSFLSEQQNVGLYHSYYDNPTQENRVKLDQAFKEFYFKIRVISYFSKILHFKAKNFDKKYRENRNRYCLILDSSLSNNEEIHTFFTVISDPYNIKEFYSSNIEDYIEDPIVYKVISLLTAKQKEILFFAFVVQLKDIEIANKLGVTPQAIRKCKNKTIERIRKRIY